MFYENYLNSLTPDTSYIPESASLTDAAIFAERAYQDIYNEAFFALASQEMAVFESMILEADGDAPAADNTVSKEKKKNLLKIIGEAFKALWTKVSGAFANAKDFIEKKFKEKAEANSNKFKSDFLKAVNNIPNDKVYKGIYDFSYQMPSENNINNVKALLTDARDALWSTLENPDEWAAEFNRDKIFSILDVNGEKSTEKKTKINIALPEKKEVKGSEIKSNAKSIADMVTNINGFMKTLKVAYKAAKETIDTCMKYAKDVMNKKDESFSIINDACKKLISLAKDVSSALTQYISQYSKVRFNIRSQYVSLMAKVIVQYGGKKKGSSESSSESSEETVSNESYTMDAFEESLNYYLEKDEPEDDEVDIDDDVEDVATDEAVEESALYRALVAYFD